MSTTAQPLPIAVAVGVPLVFLCLVRRRDLYASGRFDVVYACLLSGIVAFVFAREVNNDALVALMAWRGLSGHDAASAIRLGVAPVVEELLKSAALIYFVRRSSFTYFVDGAVYGFAAGTGFAVIENIHYLHQAADQLGSGVNRALSTALMHGCATALVGVALGRFRFERGATRAASLLLGWVAAIALHAAFNRAYADVSADITLFTAIGTGLAGVALVGAFIVWGLREERAWLRETLRLDAGVTAGESRMVQELVDLDALLAPVGARFGARKRDQVAAFLKLQAHLGLKLKAREKARSAGLRSALTREIDGLMARIDEMRRAIGVYCMVYVRAILPGKGEPLWAQLDRALLAAPAPTTDLWRLLGTKAGDAPPREPPSGQPGGVPRSPIGGT